jgi:hypothetical protein
MKAPFRKHLMLRIHGRRVMFGQLRARHGIRIDEEGKVSEKDVSERMNFDASKKYPYSSLRQQIREMRRGHYQLDEEINA